MNIYPRGCGNTSADIMIRRKEKQPIEMYSHMWE
jgi:hypothetical protein